MLTVYRRHKRACPNREEEVSVNEVSGDLFLRVGSGRCHCSFWVYGSLRGRTLRESLHTRDSKKALDVVRERQADGQLAPKTEPVRIEEATEKFLADARARGLAEQTVYKYDLLFRQSKDFARHEGIELLRDLDVDALTRFRAEWKDGPRASGKKLERLRAFLGFCRKRRWIEENPAVELKSPKVPDSPTMPYTQDEMLKILAAVERYSGEAAHNARLNAARLRALTLLLRYSGMRIGDAVSLAVDRIAGNNSLFLYTAKTGVPVRVKLPDFVVEALRSAPPVSDRYHFWSGLGKLHTAVKVWETRLRRIFRLAGIPDGHAHRFRDTFAVELLLQGVPLERVSVLLGHRGIRVTEKHYAPWVRARQEQLEADLERAWAQDSLAAFCTNPVHAESERPN